MTLDQEGSGSIDEGFDTTVCTTEYGQKCIFPFIYDDITYSECTSVDNDHPWCAYEVDSEGTLVGDEWENCAASCTCNLGWEGTECDI